MLSNLRLERARASKPFHDGVFRNTSGATVRAGGSGSLHIGEFFFGGGARIPKGPIPIESPLATWAKPISSGLRITWLGHSTMLLEADGFRILTDPVFANRASPFSFVGPKRFHAVPATLTDLPRLDAVLLSHDHYDHLCRSTMQSLAKLRVPIVIALGVGARLEQFGVDPKVITELDWWETFTFAGGALSFTATPAQHFSGRSLADRNATLWSPG